MKNETPRAMGLGRRHWALAWLIEFIASLMVALVTALLQGLSIPGALALWGLQPLLGAVAAYRAVRRGLLNYLAWLSPPIALYLAFILIWSYAPPAGAGLLSALVALIGSAAGEVYNQQHRKNKSVKATRTRR